MIDNYLHLADIRDSESIAGIIQQKKPKVILSSIEDVNNPQIQKQLQELKVAYVAVDEAQVRFKKLINWKIDLQI